MDIWRGYIEKLDALEELDFAKHSAKEHEITKTLINQIEKTLKSYIEENHTWNNGVLRLVEKTYYRLNVSDAKSDKSAENERNKRKYTFIKEHDAMIKHEINQRLPKHVRCEIEYDQYSGQEGFYMKTEFILRIVLRK